MYEQYWGLQRNPFENNSAPGFFFRSRTHQAALLKLRYVLENRLGAGLLAGGIGYGKSYLASLLAHELPDEFGPMIHVVFPQLTPREWMAHLAVELGADEPALEDADTGLDRTIRQIEKQLHEHCGRGRHPTIFVDDAHFIEDPQVFTALRSLLNFQQHRRIEFSLILIADHSLLSRLSTMGQLDERLAVKAIIQPLSYEETERYVQHRLEVAGSERRIFQPSAFEAIFAHSQGIPRRINRICDLALLVGFADELAILSANEVEAVASELTVATPV